MAIVIVIFITLSLMGSALWIMPPKQERRRMDLRMNARKHNLTVQLTSIELPDKWDKSKDKQKVCAYCLYRNKPLDEWQGSVWFLTYEVWKYSLVVDGWWMSKPLMISDQTKQDLIELREVVTAIEITRDAVSVYWHEKGDDDTLAQIARLATALSILR